MDDTDVLIAGAGPVGITLAMCLAQRGIRSLVIEPKGPDALPDVKCNHVSARSMELYRRLGVADALRGAGLPDDYPHDVSYRTSTVGREVTRIPIPGRLTRKTDTSGPDGWWPTPEPPHRINQRFLEPILLAHARHQPAVTLAHRERVTGFMEHDRDVDVEVRHEDTGVVRRVRARYLVGCDGGRSTVRKGMGIRLVGDEVVQRVQSTCIRAPDLIRRMHTAPAWAMFSVNPRRSGNVYAIDGREVWLVHNYLRDTEPDFESVDRDGALRAILGVDETFTYQMMSKEDWFGRRLVAQQLQRGRVFIAGDAAHLWVPYAGYGMNAGIADAANLAWHLAGQIEGWAAPHALSAYERERHPITEQVSHFAMNHAHAMSQRRRAIPAEIEDDTPKGQAARETFGRDLYELNVQQYCCAGLNFGYYYADSPLIVYDDEPAPPYGMGHFTSSTVPGCRTPHFWLEDGRSLYDAFGAAYTLLQLRPGCGPSAAALQSAAARHRVPLKVLDLSAHASVPAEYRHALLIARADAHTVWRGDTADVEMAEHVMARLSGRA